MKRIKRTFAKFLEDATEKHNGKYDYSKINGILLDELVPTTTKFLIVCPYHGEFHQTLRGHLNSPGCHRCCHDTRKITTETFKEKAALVHGDRYNYSLVDYNGCYSKVKIICALHGEFSQTASRHLSGAGCILCQFQQCSLTKSGNLQDFIKISQEVHNGFFSYEKTEYIKSNIPVIITCPIHGDFKQTPAAHKRGSICPQCSRDKHSAASTLTTEEFVAKANLMHNFTYDYSSTEYKNSKTPIDIICKDHGLFTTYPQYHTSRGIGCPECLDLSNNKSKGENFIISFLSEKNITYETEKVFEDCRNPETGWKLRFDFYIVDLNILIEYDGKQHFEPIKYWGGDELFEKIKHRDSIKNEYCERKGINLLRIPYNRDIMECIQESGLLNDVLDSSL